MSNQTPPKPDGYQFSGKDPKRVSPSVPSQDTNKRKKTTGND